LLSDRPMHGLMGERESASIGWFFRGRVGLAHALKTLGIRRGDSVGLQAFTCSAVPEGILAAGANPAYIDIARGSATMDPQDLARKIERGLKALVVQHTYGIPAPMGEIVSRARECGVPIIEDCCHALVGAIQGQQVGSFGVASFYSFEWGKPLVGGIGGAVTWNDPGLRSKSMDLMKMSEPPASVRAKIAIQYALFALCYRPSLYWTVRRLFHLGARLGFAKGNYSAISEEPGSNQEFGWGIDPRVRARVLGLRERYLRSIDHLQNLAAAYREGIGKADHLVLPVASNVVLLRYPILVDDKAGVLRAAEAHKVEVSDWYASAVHPYTSSDLKKLGYVDGSCPNAEALSKRVVTLPINLRVTDAMLQKTIRFFNTY
jgi:perosamine synthetase